MKTKHLILPFVPVILLSCSNQKSNSIETKIDSSKAPIEAIKEPSNEDKMIEAATAYLKQNLPDFSSYQAIEWSKIDTVYDEYNKTKEGQDEQKMIDSVVNQIGHYTFEKGNIESGLHYGRLRFNDSVKAVFNNAEAQINKLSSLANHLRQQYNYNEQHQKNGTVLAYRIDHKFRANNTNGIMNVGRLRIFTNPNYQVIKTVDLDVADQQIQEFNNAFGGLVN